MGFRHRADFNESPRNFTSNARLARATGDFFWAKLARLTRQTETIDARLLRGQASEQLAADYLQAQGLVILQRNLRCKTGELDLVCLDGDVLAIVEVRQRGRAEFGGALGSVTWRKQRKIIRAARFFLQRHAGWRRYAMRFDVVALDGKPEGAHRIEWIRDAFRAT
jgi:putative endonuclease